MSLTTDLLLDIASEKNGYRIGDPWRFSEFSLVAVIPITRVVETPRAYRLLSEVKDEVRIKDTGSINQIEIENRHELPVLLKSGEILSGATQERSLTMSQFLMSGEKIVAPCVCVHSSEGIRAGQQVKPDGFVPAQVRRASWGTPIVSGGYNDDAGYVSSWTDTSNQSQVWGSINKMSASMHDATPRIMSFMATSGEYYGATPTSSWTSSSDDLAGRLRESNKKFEAIIKKIPKTENQVGFCLVTIDGFDTLDVFNHPDSWEAIRKDILKAEVTNIADVHKDNPFQYNPEKAKAILTKLLGSEFEENNIVEKENTTTILLESGELKGEVVTLYGLPIHLSLLGKS